MNLTPNSCLEDMIGHWLQWAPGDARGSKNHATLEQLQQAVDVAGFGALIFIGICLPQVAIIDSMLIS